MLDYTRGAVTRNASEKKINSLLDFVSTSTDMKLLQACSVYTVRAKVSRSNVAGMPMPCVHWTVIASSATASAGLP